VFPRLLSARSPARAAPRSVTVTCSPSFGPGVLSVSSAATPFVSTLGSPAPCADPYALPDTTPPPRHAFKLHSFTAVSGPSRYTVVQSNFPRP